jgi:hypothetical protein
MVSSSLSLPEIFFPGGRAKLILTLKMVRQFAYVYGRNEFTKGFGVYRIVNAARASSSECNESTDSVKTRGQL